jgi:hypothetical protein
MLDKRVEVLLPSAEYARLKELAEERNESVGSLVRQAVRMVYLGPEEARRQVAFDQLLTRQDDLPDWETAKRWIEEEKVRDLEAY